VKIFISGPMTGIRAWNKEAFDANEADLSLKGHTVLSPANNIPICQPEAITHAEYVSICFAMIQVCDAVMFLDGWGNSEGSLMEMGYARAHNKRILYEGDL